MPLVIIGLIVVHLIILHDLVSQVPSRIGTWPSLFTGVYAKDLIAVIGFIGIGGMLMFVVPNYFMDAENWENLNAIVTPEHIKPEWYFLFAYGILRCIPSKAVRVMFFVMSIVIVLISPYITISSSYFAPVMLLTWLGGLEILDHYVYAAQYVSVLYFL